MTPTTAGDLRTLRVDQVGSLLRPQELVDAFARFRAGDLDEQRLVVVQDHAIRGAVQSQERLGLPVIVDGELRRVHFMQSFADVAGVQHWQERWADCLFEESAGEVASAERGLEPDFDARPPITEPLRLLRSRPLEEFTFAQALTSRPVKATLLSPDLVLRDCLAVGSLGPYEDAAALLADIANVERQMFGELVAAGCQYVQVDAPNLTVWVDEQARVQAEAHGERQEESLARALAAENAIIADAGEAVAGIHLCRGNRESTWHRSGGYERIAEQVFSTLAHDRLLLEYDTDRSGDFAPLRFVPADTVVVLGLISTKTRAPESADALKARIEDAARYVPIDRLALSPQCGFASTIRGNALTPDDQWRKLELMLEVAADVWG